MRPLLQVCLVLFSLALSASPLWGQFTREHQGEGAIRSFHGQGGVSRIKRSFQSDNEARGEFERILSTVGLGWIIDRITLRASADTDNAEAGITKDGERFIFYNALFMQRLKEKTADHWSLVSVLAHEVGHHLAFHTQIDGRYHEFELEADYFSGFVLRRLGATLNQAHSAMLQIAQKEASFSHPGRDQRLQVIALGWTDGGSPGAPRSMRDIKEPAVSPQIAAPTSPASRCETFEVEVGSERRCLKPKDTFRDCADCPEMAVIPAGAFKMGSPASEVGRAANEGPQREVRIAAPYAAAKFETTFAQWDACVDAGACDGRRPRDDGWGRGDRPVIYVSWSDAKRYAAWLSRKTGKDYRLLSEAEWEYAARAGSTTRYHFGDREADICRFGNGADSYTSFPWANRSCSDHVGDKTSEIGAYAPNAFGLHDTIGNMWEWVEDCWRDSYSGAPIDGSPLLAATCAQRVARGGSFSDAPGRLRSAARLGYMDNHVQNLGFRIARTLSR